MYKLRKVLYGVMLIPLILVLNNCGDKEKRGQFGSNQTEVSHGIVIDASDNIYIGGFTEGNLDGIINKGFSDFFAARYNQAKEKIWIALFGSPYRDEGRAITTDADGDVYITGTTYEILDKNLNTGAYDVVTLKYTPGGFKVWTEQIGTGKDDFGLGIASDGTSIYVVGMAGGSIDGNTSYGKSDAFIIKYNRTGGRLWSRQYGSTEDDAAYAVATDPSGNVYVVGLLGGTIVGAGAGSGSGALPSLPGGTLIFASLNNLSVDNRSIAVANTGISDAFLVKYDTNGNHIWNAPIDTANAEVAYAVTTDSSGNVYVAGTTAGTLVPGANRGKSDIFLAKYNSEGTRIWVHQRGTASNDVARSIIVEKTGDIYIAGYTNGGLDMHANYGDYDVFVEKFNTEGVFQWGDQIGSTVNDYGYGVAVDSVGGVYVVGTTYGNMDGNNNMGFFDAFLMKFDSSGNRL